MIATQHIVTAQLLDEGVTVIPYELLIQLYRDKLRRERDNDRRAEYEVIVTLLLSAVETQRKLDRIWKRMEHPEE